MLPDTSQMTRSIAILRYHQLKKTIKKFCLKYRDRLETYHHLAANLMKRNRRNSEKIQEIYRFTKLIFHNLNASE